MATAVSKKGLTLQKLLAFKSVKDSGMITDERLATVIKEAVDKGEIVPLTPNTFEGEFASLKDFATSFNLVKEKNGVPFNGVHRKGYAEYIKEQYPETVADFDAVDRLSSKSYKIKLDSGEEVIAQPMPFVRNITPKPADATPAEETKTTTV